MVNAQGGAPGNLYLTSITIAGETKNLNAAEVGYGHDAVGDITAERYKASLEQNYVKNWDKDRFDVMFLCTVEAARSKWIYNQVNFMLTRPKPINGDHLKDVAQSYGHTQASIHLTEFRPLSATDYSSHYKDIASTASTKANKFRELFIG